MEGKPRKNTLEANPLLVILLLAVVIICAIVAIIYSGYSIMRPLVTSVLITNTPIDIVTSTSISTPTLTQILTPTVTSTPISTPTRTSVPEIGTPTITLPAVNTMGCIPENDRYIGKVIRVVDGDTIDVQIGDKVTRVGYMGIVSPEANTRWGDKASSFNKQLVDAEEVVVVFYTDKLDAKARRLAYVVIDDVFVNWKIVISGFAEAMSMSEYWNYPCMNLFTGSQRNAIKNGSGMWGY